MTSNDPNRQFAADVVGRLKHAGFQALWAGGCVRDFLRGRRPKDYDVATNARPNEVRKLFGHRRTLAVGASFGVIIVRGARPAGDVEVATFRTEGPYRDGRRPEQVTFSTAEEDARRRDFTINGMFYDPVEQQLLDFVGGERDLNDGIVRAIGDPQARMREDKLRMLRAIRFTAAMEFELDSPTAEAVRNMAEEIRVVSAERISQELKQMLVDPHRMRAVQLAREIGLLVVILPELQPICGETTGDSHTDFFERTLRMLQNLKQPGFELALTTLLHAIPTANDAAHRDAEETGRAICRRLRLSNREIDHIAWLFSHQDALRDATHFPLSRLKRLLAHPLIDDLLALFRVKALATDADLSVVAFCEDFLQNTPREKLDPPELINGDDLIAKGLTPGADFKTILRAVRDAQLDEIISTKAEALALAERVSRDPAT
jgi:poly(A) polymerase